MKRFVLLFYVVLIISSSVSASALWQDVDRIQSRSVNNNTNKFRAVYADQDQLKALLWTAPGQDSGMQGVLIDLPLPDGSFVNVQVFEVPILAPAIAKRFPEIRTFRAVGVQNNTIFGRLDVTPNGFHAMLETPQGIVFINPEANDIPNAKRKAYRSLNKNKQTISEPFVCKTQNRPHTLSSMVSESTVFSRPQASRTFGNSLRTYRLALAATREYSIAVAGGNLNNTYAEMVTAINRVNQVFEKDVSITLQLVSGTELISTSISDFSNDNSDVLLTENQSWIDSKTGDANYDIGHIFNTGGGGLASIASVCDNESAKAQGETGSSDPVTDAFYIDYVAHEIGHQFGATHTFNASGNNSGSCDSSNREVDSYEYSTGLFTTYLAASAYEVGSGSTIMAYTGICEPQNLQDSSDAYFHARSIEQIREFVDGDIAPLIYWADGSRCGVAASSGDIPPLAIAGDDYSIPANTPFVLTGDATDSDSGELTFTYTWEQFDLGTASTTLSSMHTDNGTRPIIRSRTGTNNPQRFIPTLDAILAGTLAANIGERLPTTDRNLNFRLTVRSGTYGVSQDDMRITVDKDAGPFLVTAPTNSASYDGMYAIDVTWDVANTTAAPVSCALVDIYYSTDGGNTFPQLLLDNTPNDGRQSVQFPNITTNLGRFKVLCNNNIFFNISRDNLTVTTSSQYISLSGTLSADEGDAGTTDYTFTALMNQASASTITVNYSVAGSGSFPAAADDMGGSFPAGTITFLPGDTSKSITVSVSGDVLEENDENFTVSLLSPVNATLAVSSVSSTINNDDTDPALNLAAESALKNEGDTDSTAFTFSVTRTGVTSGSASVEYTVVGINSNPASEEDFTGGNFPTGTVNFTSGEISKTITIDISGDTKKEADETFRVALVNPTTANIATGTATGTILNDDAATYAKKSSGGGAMSLPLFILLMMAFLCRRPTQPLTMAKS